MLTGSCHCGKIAYTLDEEAPTKAISCNCSMCRRTGALHHFSTPDKFTLKGSRDDLETYQFNKHVITYNRCKICGASPFAEGKRPDGKDMVEINLRCADIDLDTLEITEFDGASH
jgi:hypothetical protein